MGQHAQDYLDMCIDHESFCDEYASGNVSLEDAFEHGLIDTTGCEIDPSLKGAWDRSFIPTPEALNNALLHAEKDLTIAAQSMKYDVNADLGESVIDCWGQENTLNKEAIANLYKEHPTCNICHNQMVARNGKFGKFYCCEKMCKGQKTVSDTYWQSVRRVL